MQQPVEGDDTEVVRRERAGTGHSEDGEDNN